MKEGLFGTFTHTLSCRRVRVSSSSFADVLIVSPDAEISTCCNAPCVSLRSSPRASSSDVYERKRGRECVCVHDIASQLQSRAMGGPLTISVSLPDS